ncbi:MAG: DUF5688 family protein, partial [Anaerovoracaceae bacterium]
MMTKEEFLQELKTQIKDYLPEEYRNAEMQVEKVYKLSEEYTGLIIRAENQTAAPTINVDRLYEAYKCGESIDQILRKSAEIIGSGTPAFETDILTDYEKARDHLFIRVCSAERNKEMLEGIPHRIEEDLAVTYHLLLTQNDNGFGSAMIMNSLMDMYGVTAEQLHQDAVNSSMKLFEPCLFDMEEMLFNSFEDKAENLLEGDRSVADRGMLVLSNSEKMHGAGSLFYPGVLDRVAELVEGNFYILPSSVHETIIVSENKDFEVEQLKALVTSANQELVSPEERLTDQVYHYDSEARVFETAEHYMDRKNNRDRGAVSLNQRISD